MSIGIKSVATGTRRIAATWVLAAAATVGTLSGTFTVAAQDAVLPAGELGVRAIEAKVSVDTANVRSGPGDNYYATTRLPRGSTVTVVGFTFDWLKISPPAGSFSYISKQYVEVAADGKTGRVKADRVNVRAGSELVATDTTIQLQLSAGSMVSVIGEAGQFYKITPPGGAFVFIRKDMVTPVRDLGPIPAELTTVAKAPVQTPTVAPAGTGSTVAVTPSPAAGSGVTAPNATATPPVEVRPPTPEQIAADARREAAEKAYDAAEAKLASVAGLPLDEQPLPEMIATYEALGDNADLPGTLRLQAQRQAAVLRSKNGTRNELIELKKLKSQQEATAAEFGRQKQEIFSKLNANANTAYTAIGQLRSSQISSGGQPLLRLVDPGTGVTIIYVRSADTGMLEQLVGVRGAVTEDGSLGIKIVECTGIAGVPATEVGKSVTGNFMPPSLLPPVSRE